MTLAIGWALVLVSGSPYTLTATTPRVLNGYTVLDRGWRFSADDDPAFARADFDDSSWRELEGGLLFGQLPEPYTQGWFRLKLNVAPELLEHGEHMLFANSAAIEVYLDGNLETVIDDIHLAPPVDRALLFRRPGPHTLAVRAVNDGARQLRDADIDVGFIALSGDRASLERYLRYARRTEATSLFFVGCAIMLGFLHLMLYAFRRTERGNLYFGLMAVSLAAIALAAWYSNAVNTNSALLASFETFKIAIVVACLFGLRFYYEVFGGGSVPKIFWGFLAAGVGAIAAMPWLGQLPVMGFAVVALVAQVPVIVRANLRRVPGAWLVGIGCAASVLSGSIAAVSSMHIFDPRSLPDNFWAFGFFVLIICTSIFLARRITRNEDLLRDLAVAHEWLQHAQARLLQSEKMASLGQLVAGIAHEINTPIGAIGSAADTQNRALAKLKSELGKELEDNAKLVSLFKVLEDGHRVLDTGSERVANLVKRLRSFARLDEAEMKKADVHQGIDESLLLMKHELGERITVTKEYGAVPELICFPGQLNQVFLNLLMNAAQAIEGKGTIHIRTFVEDGRAYVAIKDSGSGIPDANLKRIFDPGFTTKSVRVGTGLGLAICYQIIEAHKGEIKVESATGKGSTFTVIIPIS